MIKTDYSSRIKTIQSAFPDANITKLNGSLAPGLNIRLSNGILVTVWWTKNKFSRSDKPGKWYNLPGHAEVEGLTAKRMIVFIKEILLPKEVKPVEVLRKPEDYGTKLCISHITRKLEIAQKNGADKKILVTLLNLTQELKQYL